MVRGMATNSNPFGDLEDKSLESSTIETKASAADAGVVTVVAIHHETIDGVNILPGEKFVVSTGDANRLIAAKRAALAAL